MIVRPRPSLFGLLTILRGSIIPTILPRLVAVALIASGVAACHFYRPGVLPDIDATPFTLFGLALSIFLGFRNSACYDRWWESRKQWGQLVAETRSFSREVATVLPSTDPALQRRLIGRSVAFAATLRDELRGAQGGTLTPWLSADEAATLKGVSSRPDAVMRLIVAELRTQLRRGTLTDMRYLALSGRLTDMTSIQTACERLRSTPAPFTYSLLLHRTAWLFCLLVPFGLVGTLGWMTPLITVILAYAFFGLDALGDELEEPFGQSANALPLDAMVRAIEIVAAEALGDPPPKPLLPVGGLLR